MRTNTAGPTGSVTWSKVPTFNEAAYNQALAAYNANQPSSTSAPPSAAPPGQVWDPSFGVNGGYVPSSGGGGSTYTPPPVGTAPNKNDFTSYDWTQTTTLSPEQQALYNSNVQTQQNLSNQVQSALSSPIDLSNLPGMSRSSSLANQADLYASGLADRSLGDNFSTNLSDAAYRQQTRYLDPQVEQQRQQLQASLADQGFVPGTPGYEQAMRNFMDTNNRAYGAARDSAISQGYAQGNTQLGLQNSIAQMLAGKQSTAYGQDQGQRQQAINELLLPRQQSINELAAIRGGQQIGAPQGSGTSATPNLGATDIMQALNQQYQGQLGSYNAGVSSGNATLGALGSVLAAYFL